MKRLDLKRILFTGVASLALVSPMVLSGVQGATANASHVRTEVVHKVHKGKRNVKRTRRGRKTTRRSHKKASRRSARRHAKKSKRSRKRSKKVNRTRRMNESAKSQKDNELLENDVEVMAGNVRKNHGRFNKASNHDISVVSHAFHVNSSNLRKVVMDIAEQG